MGPSKAGRNRTGTKTRAKTASGSFIRVCGEVPRFQACSGEALKSKLRLKAANLADIDATIARLKEIGYLNDARFAESYAANRVEKRWLRADAGI